MHCLPPWVELLSETEIEKGSPFGGAVERSETEGARSKIMRCRQPEEPGDS